MIQYNILSAAARHYEQCEYELIEVPWAVGDEAYAVTSPVNTRAMRTFMGCLVASAEQSFVDLMLSGTLTRGRYQAITPCFRDEPIVDENHRLWFMKLELIDINPKDADAALHDTIAHAKAFFDLRTATSLEKTNDGYDLMANGIELGSYGIRMYKSHIWVYGTGVAEPRFSNAIENAKF